MRAWLVGGALSTIALICGAFKVVLEFVGNDTVEPYIAGVCAGGVLVLAGLPFARKLARIGVPGAKEESQFWMWWGTGLLLRLVLLLALGFGLAFGFPNHPAVALLAMTGVYLAGMFAEVAWVAQVLFRASKL